MWWMLLACDAEPTDPIAIEDPPTLDEPAFALCTDTGPSTTPGSSYAVDIAPIFEMCLTCHETAGTSLKFGREDSWARMVGVPSEGLPSMDRIDPGELETSYLWHKLCKTHRNIGGLGRKMPIRARLAEEEMEHVRSWIVEGAPQ